MGNETCGSFIGVGTGGGGGGGVGTGGMCPPNEKVFPMPLSLKRGWVSFDVSPMHCIADIPVMCLCMHAFLFDITE